MEIQPRDIEFADRLNLVKYQTTTALYLYTLKIGKDKFRCRNRLKQHVEWGYLSRRDELKEEDGIRYKTRDAVYQIERNGQVLLIEEGIEPYTERPWFSANIHHDFATSMSVSSIDLFSKKHGFGFLPPSHFSKKSNNEHPFTYEDVLIEFRGKSEKVRFQPDFPTFGLDYGEFGIPILGFETDMGSEVQEAELERSSMFKHILCYQALIKNGTFQGRFKLPSKKGYVLIQTTNLIRARNMVKTIEKNLGKSAVFCVAVIPKFARFKHRTTPTDELLKVEWLRAGYDPIVLSNSSSFT
jgi:hypothetical protein